VLKEIITGVNAGVVCILNRSIFSLRNHCTHTQCLSWFCLVCALAAVPTAPIITTAHWKYKSTPRDNGDVMMFTPVVWASSSTRCVVVMATDRCEAGTLSVDREQSGNTNDALMTSSTTSNDDQYVTPELQDDCRR